MLGGVIMQDDKIIKIYKKIRREYLIKKIRGNAISGHIPGVVEKLANELGIEKTKAKELIQKLPFKRKEYETLRDCKVLEVSFESGTHGSHILKPYFREADRIYLVSPFLNTNDVEHLYDLACDYDYQHYKRIDRKIDFKIITNRRIKTDIVEIRVMDVHAKFLVTDKIALLGSMNFNEKGLKSSISHELVFITRDQAFIEDLTERFLWWWELAEEIENLQKPLDDFL